MSELNVNVQGTVHGFDQFEAAMDELGLAFERCADAYRALPWRVRVLISLDAWRWRTFAGVVGALVRSEPRDWFFVATGVAIVVFLAVA